MTPSRGFGRGVSRRAFLAGAAALAGGLRTASATTRARRGLRGDRLRVAIVGAGGRGGDDTADLAATGLVDIVALCDVDQRQAADAFKKYPDAKRYSDWRRLLDTEKDIDAVMVATPDHNHAIISIAAMHHGKHVYCEKPLAHSIWEAREMARVAASTGLVTQMGTQGHAYEGTRVAVEVLRAGMIGDVRELHVWTDRPAGWWPQGVSRPVETPPVPPELDWDVWLGPAPMRPYNEAYVPFKWRGFWDFGTGAIGDMGIHNLDTAYWGLELGTPTSVSIKDCSPSLTDPAAKETAPLWSILELQFPARGTKPAVTMSWYDGGKLPPQELFQGEKLITHDGGSLVIGTKGTLHADLARRRNRRRSLSPAAAQAVRGCPDARADAAAHAEPSSRVGQRVPRQGDDAVTVFLCVRPDGVAPVGERRAARRQDDSVGSRRDARHRLPRGRPVCSATIPRGMVVLS